MSIRHLDRLLEPRSVAVIGASDRAGSVGATVWRNLRAGRFAGPVYAVNPHHDSLDGEPVHASCADLPQAPDLAVLCVPAGAVATLIEQLGTLGTRTAIVMTAGLTTEQKQSVLDAARPHLLRVLGANCLGLLSPHAGLNASFAHTDALPGVPLHDLSESVRARLDAVLPPTWSHGNPVDIIGDAPVGRYTDTLQALLAADDGAVLFMHAPSAIVRSDDIARACAPIVRQAPGRVMACWLGDAAGAGAAHLRRRRRGRLRRRHHPADEMRGSTNNAWAIASMKP